MPPTDTDVLVVGSGPGGAVTACLLAEAGREVVLLEEGTWSDPGGGDEFSRREMLAGYRNGGITAALGRPALAYAEGRAVGGGSEINAGLYHRLPEPVRERWVAELHVAGLDAATFRAHFEAIESGMPFITAGYASDGLSKALLQGAAKLGWPRHVPPRLRTAGAAGQDCRAGMSRTWLRRFLAAGGELRPGIRAGCLQRRNGGWHVRTRARDGKVSTTRARHVFLACGAIQTPALLRASGIRRNVGDALRAHVTVKAAAEFAVRVVQEREQVCPVQVKPGDGPVSLGCSVSGPRLNRVFFLDRPEPAADPATCAITYAAVSVGSGRVRRVPLLADPVVRYRLTDADLRSLARGLRQLGEWLFAAGAAAVHPGSATLPTAHSPEALRGWPEILPRSGTPLQTVHLMASCPLGENRARCAVDSFGAVHGVTGLHVADASMLGSATGVNPQGTIMALARRNALHFLEAST